MRAHEKHARSLLESLPLAGALRSRRDVWKPLGLHRKKAHELIAAVRCVLRWSAHKPVCHRTDADFAFSGLVPSCLSLLSPMKGGEASGIA